MGSQNKIGLQVLLMVHHLGYSMFNSVVSVVKKQWDDNLMMLGYDPYLYIL
jgi:hypothetical protein